MSTIQSSNEHLTINASGAGKEIKLQNNGTTNVTLGSSGNMGVGTTTPASKLHIVGSQARFQGDNNSLQHYNNAGSRYAYVATQSDGYIVDVESTGSSTFKVKSSGSEKIRVDTDGLKFNGDTAAANALDDYEEGTWTPTNQNGTFSINTVNYAKYTKIGDVVVVTAYLDLGSNGDATAFNLGGLPFSVPTYGYATGVVNVGGTTVPMVCRAESASTHMRVQKASGTTWALENEVAIGSHFIFEMTYKTTA